MRRWDVARQRSPAPVAQGIERRFPKPCVAGSNPAGGAKIGVLERVRYSALDITSRFMSWGAKLLSIVTE